MLRSNYFLAFIFILFLLASSCAKKGRPSGGPRDEDAPLLVTANPPYETTNFKTDEIKIEFNEYITLKELNKQLVVSPPLKNNPIITPQGTPSKFITINIMDTLPENTTYIFDFGKSVQDNNEGNQLEKFKYVFSTGSFIDSLTLNGEVKDAYKSKSIKNIKLLLYRADSTYKDSMIYNQKPNYVSSTLDTTKFEFSNLSPGEFYLIALEDKNSDYFFDPKQDKIGFYDKLISLPQDSIVLETIPLFRENLSYSFSRAKEVTKGKIIIGFNGKANTIEIEPLSKVSKDFVSNYKFEIGKDTLNYWFHNYEKDSIILLIRNKNIIDTATINLRKKQLDSLVFSNITRTVLEFKDTLLFSSNNPIIAIDTSKICLFDKDTLTVKYSTFISLKENKLGLLFDKKFDNRYQIELYPNAIRDIYGFTNDSLKFTVRTRKLDAYGDLSLNISNPDNKNLIIQLLDTRDVLLQEENINTSKKITFKYIRPKKVKVRIIHDQNNNGTWDTGSFLDKRQPEKLFYYDKIFEIRANWSLNEAIVINKDF